jgi:hypothetical protein
MLPEGKVDRLLVVTQRPQVGKMLEAELAQVPIELPAWTLGPVPRRSRLSHTLCTDRSVRGYTKRSINQFFGIRIKQRLVLI